MSEAIRFRFDLADLLPPAVDLRVIDGGVPLPAEARSVRALPRPSWLPPLLPIFAAGRSLRVDVTTPSSPVFGGLLLDALAGLFASAGAGSGTAVIAWSHGFVVGCHGQDRMPECATVSLVPADLVAASLEQARTFLGLLPTTSTLLVINGSLPRVERPLAIPSASRFRMPLLGPGELGSAAGGISPSLGSRRYGGACLELGRVICGLYRDALP